VTEIWRPVVGYDGLYEVSDFGQVRSIDRVVMRRNRWGEFAHKYAGKPIHPDRSTDYLRVKLSKDGIVRRASVHELVAAAFIGPKPAGLQICHNDGDSFNNCADNLRYGTPSENMLDSVGHGTHVAARKTHCPQGHPYDEANTWRAKTRNQRLCRACSRIRQRELRKVAV
jgi:hypothetical protein